MGVLKTLTPDGWRKVGCGGVTSGSGSFAFGLPYIRLYFPTINSFAGPFTLSFEFRAEPTNGVTSTFDVAWYDGSANHALGSVTSAPGSGTGPAFSPWTAFSFNVSAYVASGGGNYARWIYSAGAATGYVRRMKITTGNGTVLFGQYPLGLPYTSGIFDGIPGSGYDSLGSDGASTASQYSVAVPASGRLRLWTGTAWVREACDGEDPAWPVHTDNFNRSNGPLGGAFTDFYYAHAADWVINGNQAQMAVSAQSQASALFDIGSRSADLSIDVTALPPYSVGVNRNGGLYWNASPSGQFLFFANLVDCGIYQLGPGGTTLVFFNSSGGGLATYRVVHAPDGTLTVYRNGVSIGSTTVALFSTGTLAGILADNSTTRQDNFSVQGLDSRRHPLKIKVASGGGTLFSDNFNRANGALGSPWTAPHGGTWTVTSNQALMTAAPGGGMEPVAVVPGTTLDATVQADLTVAVHPGASIIFNYLSPGNFCMWNIAPGTSALYKFTAHSPTGLASPAAAGSGTYKVVIDPSGSVDLYKNGTLVQTVAVAFHTGGFGAGVQSAVANSNPADNFSVVANSDVWTTVACMVPV